MQDVNQKRALLVFFLEKNKSNPSNIWKSIRQLIILKGKNRIQPNILTINGKRITNPTKIANELKNYFVNVEPKRSQKILKSQLFKR